MFYYTKTKPHRKAKTSLRCAHCHYAAVVLRPAVKSAVAGFVPAWASCPRCFAVGAVQPASK